MMTRRSVIALLSAVFWPWKKSPRTTVTEGWSEGQPVWNTIDDIEYETVMVGSDGEEWFVVDPHDDLIWHGDHGWAITSDGPVSPSLVDGHGGTYPYRLFTKVRFG